MKVIIIVINLILTLASFYLYLNSIFKSSNIIYNIRHKDIRRLISQDVIKYERDVREILLLRVALTVILLITDFTRLLDLAIYQNNFNAIVAICFHSVWFYLSFKQYKITL